MLTCRWVSRSEELQGIVWEMTTTTRLLVVFGFPWWPAIKPRDNDVYYPIAPSNLSYTSFTDLAPTMVWQRTFLGWLFRHRAVGKGMLLRDRLLLAVSIGNQHYPSTSIVINSNCARRLTRPTPTDCVRQLANDDGVRKKTYRRRNDVSDSSQ